MKLRPNTVVIDVSGGVVQAVFSNVPGLDVVLVDWDNINEGDSACVVGHDDPGAMPESTAQQIRDDLPDYEEK